MDRQYYSLSDPSSFTLSTSTKRPRVSVFGSVFGLGTALFMVGCSIISQSIPDSTPTPSPTRTATPIAVVDSTSPAEPSRIIPEGIGNLQELVNSFQDEMPRASTGAYRIPTKDDQATFHDLVLMVTSGNFQGGLDVALRSHYSLLHFSDRAKAGLTSYLLYEDKPIQKGWGFYAFRDGNPNGIIVEAPHPIADENTPGVASDVYEELYAQALLIAGAHRDANHDGSADVAHYPESIFQSIHTALLQGIPTRKVGPVVLQIHGYSINKHANYPQVVVGLGQKPSTNEIGLANKIVSALEEQGVTAALCDGKSWQDLCGTKNMQASVMDAGTFIHLELDRQVREDDSAFITALKHVFSQ